MQMDETALFTVDGGKIVREEFFYAGLNDFRQQFAWHQVITIRHELSQVDHIILVDQRWIAMTIGDF